jgi:hypothetical protein
MKMILFDCVMVLIIGLPVYLLYWHLFRPVLIQRLKYRLFQVRDDLRLLLVNGDVGTKEKAYPLVEQFCNNGLVRMEMLDLTILAASKPDKQAALEVERDWEIIFNSGPEMRRHFFQTALLLFGAACANSPGILVLMAPLLIGSVLALWFNSVKLWFYGLIKRAVANILLQPAKC